MAEFSYVLKENYLSSFDTLKNTSYDKNNNDYMCQSDLKVLDFDKLTKELNLNKQPSSYDALLIKNEKVYCVEFKNQTVSDIKNNNIQKKVEDSIKTIKNICNEHNIQQKDYDFFLCVVYKQDKNKKKYHRFKENIVHFGLNKYKNRFKNIITNDIKFFKKEFEKEYTC